MLVWPWGERGRRRGLVDALTMTLLASTVVTWRGPALLHARQLLADTRGSDPGYARLRRSLRREFGHLASEAPLPVEQQLQALRAAAELLGHHGMTSDELQTATAEHAAGAVLARAAGSHPAGAVPAGVAVLCRQLLQAGYERLLTDPDWTRRR